MRNCELVLAGMVLLGCSNPGSGSQTPSATTDVAGAGATAIAATAGASGAAVSGTRPPLGAGASGGRASASSGGTFAAVSGTGGSGGARSVAAGSGGRQAVAAAGSGTLGSGGATGSAGSTATASDCGANLLPIPDDTGVRGPWDAAVRTVKLGRVTAELFYPAEPGSSTGKPEVTYNPRDWLPAEDKSKVPEANSMNVGVIGGHLYRDVPIDAAHGPYPLVIYIHGTASFRAASASVFAHWASRGFVVAAADYPGLGLADQLNSTCGRDTLAQDIPGDVNAQIDAIGNATGDVAFLAAHVDMKRIGLSGHSQGGCVAATLTTIPGVQIVIPMDSSTTVTEAPGLKSLMFVGGIADTVIGYDSVALGNIVCPAPSSSAKGAYMDSPATVTKRLVGVTGGGHLTPTDLCQTNARGNNAIQEASADGVCGIDTAVIIGLPALFDCGMITFDKGVAAVSYASAAALEETLQCADRTKAFADLQQKLPQVGELAHTP